MISFIVKPITHYIIDTGDLWDINTASWVKEVSDDAVIGTAPDKQGNLSIEGLKETLIFYDKPLGELLNISEAKQQKLAEIDKAWQEAERVGKIESSLGFNFDATERSNRDVSGLITKLSVSPKEEAFVADTSSIIHPVTLEQLQILQVEIIQRGQQLYAIKWDLQSKVNNANNVQDILDITVEFPKVTDFKSTENLSNT